MSSGGGRLGTARSVVAQVLSLPVRSRPVGRVSGLRSKVTMTGLVLADTLPPRPARPAATALPVRVKNGEDQTVWLRPCSTDAAAFRFVYHEYHLPPPDLTGPIRHVAVFGANIGLLVADLGRRYPQAQMLGVEPDPDNAAVARQNVAHLRERCRLLETAVWHRDENLTLAWDADAWGQLLTTRSGHAGVPDRGNGGELRHQAIDAGRVLAEFAGPEPVDYLLVNIESAWYEMLRHGRWTEKVRCIKIEIQDHYDEAVPLLEQLGYRARLQRLSWGAFATGVAEDRS